MADFFHRLSEQVIHPASAGQGGAVQPLLRPRFAGSTFFPLAGEQLTTSRSVIGAQEFSPLATTRPVVAGAAPLATLRLRALATAQPDHLETPTLPAPTTDADTVAAIHDHSAAQLAARALAPSGSVVPATPLMSAVHAVEDLPVVHAAPSDHQVDARAVESYSTLATNRAADAAVSQPTAKTISLPAVPSPAPHPSLTAEAPTTIRPKRAAVGTPANAGGQPPAPTNSGSGATGETPPAATAPPVTLLPVTAPIDLAGAAITQSPTWRATLEPSKPFSVQTGADQHAVTPPPVTPSQHWTSPAALPYPAAPQGDEQTGAPAPRPVTVAPVMAATAIAGTAAALTPILAMAAPVANIPPGRPQPQYATERVALGDFTEQAVHESQAVLLRNHHVQPVVNAASTASTSLPAMRSAAGGQGGSPLASPVPDRPVGLVHPQPLRTGAAGAPQRAVTPLAKIGAQQSTGDGADQTPAASSSQPIAQPGVVPPWRQVSATPATKAAAPQRVEAGAAAPTVRLPVTPAEPTPMPRPGAPLPPRPSTTAADPIIRVTIGRVEVRTGNPAPAMVRQSAPAALSLDAYLQKTPRRSG